MDMRYIEVGRARIGSPNQRLVAGEGKPGGVVGRKEPGVAEDATGPSLDKETGMAESRNPQSAFPSPCYPGLALPVLASDTQAA